jgi:tetratricopeptide (TPR) repeat protein
MKIFKIANILAILIFTIVYLSGCSSTEQTTGKLAFQQGDWAKAEAEFQKEVNNNPLNEEAWFYLGATKLRLNKLTEAQEAFDQYRKIGKNSFANEITSEWEKKYDEAYKQYDAARSEKEITAKIKKYEDAINQFRIAYVILPDSVVVLKNISALNDEIANLTITPLINEGADLLNANKFAEAIAKFEDAKKYKIGTSNPKYFILQFNTSLGYIKWGEDMRVNATDPNDKSYQEKYRAAIPYLEELTKSPDDNDKYNAYVMLVQVYANLNMAAEAEDAIKKRDELKVKLGK